MKRILTLALALVLALGLAVPAMAFTSDTDANDAIPFDLKIYLVEYDDNDLFGIVTLPESDRGYAKNEIVAAVVELSVPEGEDPHENYDSLVFGGVNVDLNVADNKIVNGTPDTATITTVDGTEPFMYDDTDDRLIRGTTGLTSDSDETYKWLFYAKVEDDDAMLVAKLVDGTAGQEFDDPHNPLTITLDGVDYSILKTYHASTGGNYTISGDGDTIIIYIDEDYVSTGMRINGKDLGVNTKGELGIVVGTNASIETGDDAEDILDVYNDVVVDVFGMDYFLIGNYVRDSFFENLSSPDTLVAMVEIQPWTAYVTVPDNIVVDPPKTGDAASIMGFVMVALSGAGVVALRKRG